MLLVVSEKLSTLRYYIARSGKRFRSMSEVQSFLNEHPEYPGVTVSQFSFQTPAPMEENYVRKRRASSAASHEMSDALMPVAAIPISWIAPDQLRDLHFGEEGTLLQRLRQRNLLKV